MTDIPDLMHGRTPEQDALLASWWPRLNDVHCPPEVLLFVVRSWTSQSNIGLWRVELALVNPNLPFDEIQPLIDIHPWFLRLLAGNEGLALLELENPGHRLVSRVRGYMQQMEADKQREKRQRVR